MRPFDGGKLKHVCSDTQQTEKEFIMTQNNEVRDLKRQKQALEESLIALKQSTSSQNNKLKVLRQDYQQKLQSLVQQVRGYSATFCIHSGV